MRKLALLLVLLVMLGFSESAQARKPAPPVNPARGATVFQVEKIGLSIIIDGQKAKCTMKHVIYNPTASPIEVDYLAPLPEGGNVTGIMLFDGKEEMVGQIYDKDKAFDIYRRIVSQRRDPALLEYAGRDTFRARIFPVPAKGRQTLELNFDYLLPQDSGQAVLNFPLAGPMTSGQKTNEVDVQVILKNSDKLGAVYSSTAGLEVKREKGQDVVASLNIRKSNVPPLINLTVQNEAKDLGAIVMSHKPDADDDGFFLLTVEPSLQADEKIVPKNVVFALDKSGSMDGTKFKQAKEALMFVLERLNDVDNFNLVDYNGTVSTWKPELMEMNKENRKAAAAYIKNLRSAGTTNIEGALSTSMKMVGDPKKPNYIIFLTDGEATKGERNEMKLAAIAKEANSSAARIFSFGVGNNVNARLLDRLSGDSGGYSIFVSPNEDIESKVSSFFSKITSPALTKPKLGINIPVNRIAPENMPDLFSGQQLVVLGRYPKGGKALFTLKGMVGDKEETFEYEVNLSEKAAEDGQFIAQTWAQRRIGQIIDEIDMDGGTPNQELLDELINLSKRYGILTPYTSFLALESQAMENAAIKPLVEKNLSIMHETVGESANRQRDVKQKLKIADAAPKSSERPVSEDELMALSSLDKTVLERKVAPYNSVALGKDEDRLVPPNQMADKIFFMKNGQWRDSSMSEEQAKNAKRIKQFSDEYFALAAKLKSEQMKWLAQNEETLFVFEGQSYLIEPAEKAVENK